MLRFITKNISRAQLVEGKRLVLKKNYYNNKNTFLKAKITKVIKHFFVLEQNKKISQNKSTYCLA